MKGIQSIDQPKYVCEGGVGKPYCTQCMHMVYLFTITQSYPVALTKGLQVDVVAHIYYTVPYPGEVAYWISGQASVDTTS